MSGKNYPLMHSQIPEEWNPQTHMSKFSYFPLRAVTVDLHTLSAQTNAQLYIYIYIMNLTTNLLLCVAAQLPSSGRLHQCC